MIAVEVLTADSAREVLNSVGNPSRGVLLVLVRSIDPLQNLNSIDETNASEPQQRTQLL